MKRIKHHIIYATLGILLVLLTVANAGAQIVVDECDTMEFSVVSRPNIPETHFVWGIYEASDSSSTDVLDPAGTLDPALYFVDGMYANNATSTESSVKVVGLEPGKYYVRIHIWDEVTCTDNIEMYVLEVIETIPEIVLEGDSVCIDEQPTFVKITFSGVGPYNIVYSIDDGNTQVNVNGIVEQEYIYNLLDPLPVGETTFWVISVENSCKAYEFPVDDRPNTGILIYPKPTNSRIYLKDD